MYKLSNYKYLVDYTLPQAEQLPKICCHLFPRTFVEGRAGLKYVGALG